MNTRRRTISGFLAAALLVLTAARARRLRHYHGNGYATLYAHQRQLPLVQVGDTVRKGQVVGCVGNTGNSYGAHLHFELRVNGVRDNVLKLYPNLNFIDRS